MPRCAAEALALALVVLVAGCDSSDPVAKPTAVPTVSVKQAQRTYSPLMSVLSSALASSASQAPPPVRREVLYYDGDMESCAYAAHLTFPGVVFGSDVPWPEVRAAAQGVLGGTGFTLTDQLDIPGGYNGFDATAGGGATIQVRSKTSDPSTVSLIAPVLASPCPEYHHTLEPLGR